MGIFDIFKRQNPPSAKIAKERLQIIVAHQRNGRNTEESEHPIFMEDMKREILDVVQKYVQIDASDIEASIDKDGDIDVLALNINLPDKRT